MAPPITSSKIALPCVDLLQGEVFLQPFSHLKDSLGKRENLPFLKFYDSDARPKSASAF